jgi:lipid A 3-O-deacylase
LVEISQRELQQDSIRWLYIHIQITWNALMSQYLKLKLPVYFIALTCATVAPAVQAIDAVSLEFATGNRTQISRVGAQWDPHQQFDLWGTDIHTYYRAELAYWKAGFYLDQPQLTQHLWDIGLTPTFRLEGSDRHGAYSELGIGAHLLSAVYDVNGRRESTHLQFGSHVAAGYVWSNDIDLSLKIQHVSNAGIKHPNMGVNFLAVRIARKL